MLLEVTFDELEREWNMHHISPFLQLYIW
jgi:hypothetical protein